jgi:ribosome-binding protein aMBF1 (putative translation factor)
MPALTRAQVAVLSEAILARGLDVHRLGQAIGHDADVVRMIMDGRLKPAPGIRRKLAAALGVDPALIGEQ